MDRLILFRSIKSLITAAGQKTVGSGSEVDDLVRIFFGPVSAGGNGQNPGPLVPGFLDQGGGMDGASGKILAPIDYGRRIDQIQGVVVMEGAEIPDAGLDPGVVAKRTIGGSGPQAAKQDRAGFPEDPPGAVSVNMEDLFWILPVKTDFVRAEIKGPVPGYRALTHRFP